MATGNIYRKFSEIWTVFGHSNGQTDKQTDEQTNKQTYRHEDRSTSQPYRERSNY